MTQCLWTCLRHGPSRGAWQGGSSRRIGTRAGSWLVKDCRFGIGREKDGFVSAAGTGPVVVVGIGTIGTQSCVGMGGWDWVGKIGILVAAGAGRMCWGFVVDVDGWVAAVGKTGKTGVVFERPASWTEV